MTKLARQLPRPWHDRAWAHEMALARGNSTLGAHTTRPGHVHNKDVCSTKEFCRDRGALSCMTKALCRA